MMFVSGVQHVISLWPGVISWLHHQCEKIRNLIDEHVIPGLLQMLVLISLMPILIIA